GAKRIPLMLSQCSAPSIACTGMPSGCLLKRKFPVPSHRCIGASAHRRIGASAHRMTARHYISPVSTTAPTLFDYARFVEDLKRSIDGARLSAARAVNRELVALYWDIGQAIREQQARRGWGDAVVDRLARDLKASFPGPLAFQRRASGACVSFTRPTPRRSFSHSLCEKASATSNAPKVPRR
ncbi:hypothetical protein J7E62_28325, partial [Variovorax paradoxus]|nr:hypothetical protein [Variovorax paradoxus]